MPKPPPALGVIRSVEEKEAPNSETLFDGIAQGLELVESAMREQLGSDADIIAALGSHVLSSGGKRLRPALVLLAADLCGYTGPRRIQLGAALELLHTATLLHDDVVDFADLRRGRPSANAVWGNRRAVLAGDFFYSRASSMIVEDGNPQVLEIFAKAIRLMAEGELLQLERSFDTSVTEAHYYKVVDRKSATLLSAACEVGAVLGGVTRGEARQVATFGRELGIAFQLRDDALDYDAEAVALGKPHCADLREGKVTLPLILTLKRCTSRERELITSVLKNASRLASRALGAEPGREAEELEIDPVLALIESYRGVEDTVRRAEEHVSSAVAAIAAFPDGRAKSALHSAADFAVSRDR
jgi:octaprenyl-diphosphate synthase